MRYYIIAGEASGDIYGANLMHDLQHNDSKSEFRFWGGDLMQKYGGTPIKHYKELAFMGFIPVIMNIRTILNNISFCKKDIKEYNPDVLILIDYPGFNLKIAKFAKSINLKVFYYISPTVWAWHKSRINIIKSSIDKLFVILPFEKEFFKQHNYHVDYFGHPLLDEIEAKKKDIKPRKIFLQDNNLSKKKIIAILPGSRKQEISKILLIMISIVKDFSEYQFIIAGAPGLNIEFYKSIIRNQNISIVFNQTYSLLKYSVAAIVTSGTATLETALFNVPEIVCYKTNWLTFSIAKKIINLKYISLVNLILDKEAVKELIQDDLTSDNIKDELYKILINKGHLNKIKQDYIELNNILGNNGASKKIADAMYKYLTTKT